MLCNRTSSKLRVQKLKPTLLSLLILTSIGPLHRPAVPSPQTLLTIQPTKDQPRNSEGDIVELKDGRLCLVYTRFTGGARDHSAADLAMRTSGDNGTTWSDDRILLPNEGKCNIMSVSILRLTSGEMLLFYLRKDERLHTCSTYVRRSRDEFQTLGPPTRVTLLDGYHVVNNDRALELSSGRLIVPAALHTAFDQTRTKITKFTSKGIPMVYYSDNTGWTWHRANMPVVPVEQRDLVLQEPGVVELKDGRLWMFMRTTHGCQYGCYSNDGGITWSTPKPTNLISPCSPATIERIPWTGDLLCVWNDHSGAHTFTEGKRRPLCVAISADDGRTWSPSRVIEPDPDGWFCYTSMTFVNDRAILAYCAGDSRVGGLNRLKVTALTKDWLYPDPARVPGRTE
jgi:sialidase-1